MIRASTPFDAFDLPPPWPRSLLDRIRTKNRDAYRPIVILDDDPLGGQCVHDIPVLTTWDTADLAQEMQRSPAFLLLTNTRALTRPEAVKRADHIGFSLQQAALETAALPTVVWRSDSTLRGHFWWETSAFAEAFKLDGMSRPVHVFLPYFGEGGRFTLDDVQCLLQEALLVPVHETEFARDPAFAYSQSHLPSWLAEHSQGQVRADDVVSLSLKDLRHGGPERVAEALSSAPEGGAVVVNAVDDRDLEVFVAGLQEAEDAGGYFLCSGAAPFVRARLGQERAPLLTAGNLQLAGTAGGLTVVGSYVDKTTAQLERALTARDVCAFELNVDAGESGLASAMTKRLATGQDVVLHTNRTPMPGEALAIAEALARVVRRLDVRPRYLLVKGGSTASHLATDALGVKRAVVLGQLLAGVPVWRLGDEVRWPGLPFVIFAGNVGTDESLLEALNTLRGS